VEVAHVAPAFHPVQTDGAQEQEMGCVAHEFGAHAQLSVVMFPEFAVCAKQIWSEGQRWNGS